jgi:hypothetical protein
MLMMPCSIFRDGALCLTELPFVVGVQHAIDEDNLNSPRWEDCYSAVQRTTLAGTHDPLLITPYMDNLIASTSQMEMPS